jgi:indole-3-glycerol phosphate synthase
MSRLEELVEAARRQAGARQAQSPPEELRSRLGARGETQSLAAALSGPGIAVIAEFKRGSPSAGPIRPDADVGEVVDAYSRGGAAAPSIPTEEEHFLGSLDDLRRARGASPLPVLRKDFVVDPYQLLEAVVAGADAVLLIAAALDDSELAGLAREAAGLDLECLVEVHDEAELERALALGAPLIGINNRDLRDLSVDLGVTRELAGRAPVGTTLVAESGFSSPDQLEELGALGIDAVLVGESLMRSGDPEQGVRALVSAGAPGEGSESPQASRPRT